MRFRTFKKTLFTSRETVCSEGKRYPGRPVFIRDRNPRSFIIPKGRLLSQTQRTISALGQGVKMETTDVKGTYLASAVVC
jgi:hypothetical protein